MASLRHERQVDAPADFVWAVIRDPASIPAWFPGIVSCTVEGTRRTIRTATGLEIPEEILVSDALLRRFAYRITAPLYELHVGTIDVFALDSHSSLCVYGTTALPDTLALIVAGATKGALEEIARLAETSYHQATE
ncbi:MAG TPA: SRPBCC family protein [Acidimicrobiales bacterium]|nr:MAG: hypothetical protein B7X07_02115 [Actinobacteria bacterium 21-64-8]HQT99006.1 SRPBCC family protein [Acidimicrobiales bacterium]